MTGPVGLGRTIVGSILSLVVPMIRQKLIDTVPHEVNYTSNPFTPSIMSPHPMLPLSPTHPMVSILLSTTVSHDECCVYDTTKTYRYRASRGLFTIH